MSVAKPRARAHQIGTPAKATAEPEVVELDEEPGGLNLLEALQEELGRSAAKEPYTLTVPNRPKMSLTFDVNFDFPTFQAWSKKCEDRKTKEVNFYNLAVIVISNQNTAIRLDNQDVEQDGDPMLITSPNVHKWLGVPVGSTSQAIRKLYGSDGHAIQTARMVIEQAGYTMEGDVLEAEDGPLESS